MKIARIRIQNLRAFEDEEIVFDDYTALVGANGAGKSTILCALNIFFREVENSTTNMTDLDAEDFHLKDTTKPIRITVTFGNLDAKAEELFADYVRQGQLIISAEANYEAASGRATVHQYGQRLAMADFAPYFAADSGGAKAEVLKQIFAELRAKYPDIKDEKFKDPMRAALRTYEEAHPEACVLIPSQDQFYGFSRGANRLGECVQWVYVPAVKDATKEQLEARTTALGRLLARTVRNAVKFDEDLANLQQETIQKYNALLADRQEPLAALSEKLQLRLAEWAHPDVTVTLAWEGDPKRSVQIEEPLARMMAGEGSFEGELGRFGHGLQRSYLLALLQELAAADDHQAPTLLLGIEEPELYQHPPQARHLASVLETLSSGNTQIIVSTHSPQFVSGRGFAAVRMVRKVFAEQKTIVRQTTSTLVGEAIAAAKGEPPAAFSAMQAKLNQALQPGVNEMFFTPRLILVEGLEDVALITSWLVLTDRWGEFRKRGCHLIPVNGKSELIQPLVVATHLEIPTFVVFDADRSYAGKADQAPKHEADNKALLNLLGADASEPFPKSAIWAEDHAIWPENLDHELCTEVGKDRWEKLYAEASLQFGNPKGFGKNSMHIASKLALAHAAGDKLSTLDKLCDHLLNFAN